MEYTIKKVLNSTRWVVKGQFHREDGPAIVYDNGGASWWRHDKLHRIGGPAVECEFGNHLWYIDGKQFTQAAYSAQMAKLAKVAVAV